MSYTIDLATHGKDLKRLYDAIVSSDPEVSWAVFNYGAGASNALKPTAQGPAHGDYLTDFVDEFDDGKVQYGFVRIDYNNLPKFVLVGWVGEGVPERTKGYFNAHYATVAKYFHGYHVQITARSSSDVSPAIIMDKVDGASGSKYSSGRSAVPLRPKYTSSSTGADEADWGDAPAVQEKEGLSEVQSSYRPTKVDISSIRSAAEKKPAPEPVPKLDSSTRTGFQQVQSSYQPVGKIDIAALRAQSKSSKFGDDRPTPLQSSYQPVGKVDIAAIRAQASQREVPDVKPAAPKPAVKAEPKPKFDEPKFDEPKHEEPEQVEDEEDAAPKSVKDRMSVFSNSGRLSALPKPKVNRSAVASRFEEATRGTAPSAPKDSFSPIPKAAAASGFKDFGSEGGKTPAQLWAERHAKAGGSTSSSAPAPAPSAPSEPEQPLPTLSSLRAQFGATTIGSGVDTSSSRGAPSWPPKETDAEDEAAEDEPVDEEPDRKASFADITSRFAKSSSPVPAPLPPREPEPEQEPEVLPPPEEYEQAEPGEPDTTEPEQEDAGREASIAAALSEGTPVETSKEQLESQKSGPLPSNLTAVVVYDYAEEEPNELSLTEGELISEIEKVDPEWWEGTNSQGKRGLFPSNYVEIVDDSHPNGPAAQAAEKLEAVHQQETAGPSAVAEYDYEAQEEGELSFPEGATITDIDFVDESWWEGSYEGSRGLLPANYVSLKE